MFKKNKEKKDVAPGPVPVEVEQFQAAERGDAEAIQKYADGGGLRIDDYIEVPSKVVIYSLPESRDVQGHFDRWNKSSETGYRDRTELSVAMTLMMAAAGGTARRNPLQLGDDGSKKLSCAEAIKVAPDDVAAPLFDPDDEFCVAHTFR